MKIPTDENTGVSDYKDKTKAPFSTQYANQYPTLPSSNDVDYRLSGEQQQQQQEQYPSATYPGQNEYQRKGIPYNSSANETTRLINN